MIISPLEQFNICPLWAFAVIDITNLGIFFSKTLFNIWLILSEIACTATRVFGFDPITDHDKTTFFMAYGVVGVARYTTLFLSSTFVFIWTALSGELVANVYRDTFSYFESLHSEHYDLVALTKTLSSIEPRNVVGTSYLEYDSAFAMILSGAYCAITELALTMFSLVRGFGLDLLLNLSNQDFTYLILSVNTSTI